MKKSEKINIVMFNMSSYYEWEQGIQNRNFHILKHLSLHEKVNKILAVDYLPHTFKRFLRNYKENIIGHTDDEIIYKTAFSRAVKIDEKLSILSSVVSKISKSRFYFDLKETLKALEMEDFVLWSYYPLEVGYFKQLESELKVFDTVDNWSEHPSYSKIKNQLLKNYKIVDQEADLIFTVSEELQDFYTNKEKVHWIQNGVDLKHYQKEYSIINRDIGNLRKPIVGYVGTIQDRFNLDLFEYLVKSNPDKSFVLVGPVWYKEIKDRLSKFNNVYFLGRKSYQEIPMYIQQFDVGLIPHKVDKFIKSTNPMKMYEYLACGKPMVSTKGSGIEQFKEVAYIADDFKQFNIYLNQAITEDNDNLRLKRVEAVKNHSWLKRVERMLELIFQKV